MAACLALGMSASVVRSLVAAKTQLCHPGAQSREVGMQSALYDHGPLSSFLTEVFAALSISDADRFLVLATLEYGIDQLGMHLDHNLDTPSTRVLSEMLLPSMSSPILFPTTRRGFDAGTASPNLSMAAALLVAARFRIPLSEVIVISLGASCRVKELPSDESLNWGAQQWLPHLAQVARDGASKMEQVLGAEACGEKFIHFAPTLSESLSLDECDAERVQKLASEVDIAPLAEFVRRCMADL